MTYGPLRFPKSPSPPSSPVHTSLRPRVERPARILAGGKFVTTATLTSRTCKWPIGDPVEPGFHYCGLPPESGRAYCDAHDRKSRR
jgi:GcrA cell cycle regulator